VSAVPNLFPPAMQAALRALHGPLQPLSDAERAQFNSERAAEMRRAELRRKPIEQGDLLDTHK
jgi:hypothetical protein